MRGGVRLAPVFQAGAEANDEENPLVIALDGYEGPLHVLLALAQSQKVDLLKLSVTRLAEQYLDFVREARKRRFGLAAEYLVMAAWLAYLKSRLLLPKPVQAPGEEAPPEAVAAQLAFRLAKLAAMRDAAQSLMDGKVLRRDVFPRGDPQATTIISNRPLEGDLFALMTAYVGQRRRAANTRYSPATPASWRLDDARDHVRGLIPTLLGWTGLTTIAPAESAAEPGAPTRASFIASTLSASLEFVREGHLEARQSGPFAEIYLRAREVAS